MFLLGVSGESGADSELLANKEISFSFLDPLFMSGWDKKIWVKGPHRQSLIVFRLVQILANEQSQA